MEISMDKPKKQLEMEFKGSVNTLLKKLGINPETVIVVRDGEILTEDDSLKDVDVIRIMSVVSGG
ncbi:MAG: MoaD/ThiS family protein [Candidatus Woesearchaeota archaeon]|nr:MoaD/ThiS family protein [Candidatus Woesearchaeota archaeon]